MTALSPERTRDAIARLSHRGLGVRDFSLGVARILRRAVAFDGVCVMTMDPATLLPTGHVIEGGLPEDATPRLAEIELLEDDVNKFAALARGKEKAASLSAATGGDLMRSRRHRELRRPNGFEDELRASFASESGTWGGLVLMRAAGRAHFGPAEVRLVASVSGLLAEGLRRAILLGAWAAGEGPDRAVGMVLLGDDDAIEATNAAAAAWLAELAGDDTPSPRLPYVIRTVAARARSLAAGRASEGSAASARIRTRSGQWVLVRGSVLGDGPEARTVVMLEAVRAAELAPLIADGYGLTARERAVTQLVAQGLPTSEIAARLLLSPYTVQDHLKAIFEKVGVGTRGELVARLFFDHYAPRLADGAAVDASGWFASAVRAA